MHIAGENGETILRVADTGGKYQVDLASKALEELRRTTGDTVQAHTDLMPRLSHALLRLTFGWSHFRRGDAAAPPYCRTHASLTGRSLGHIRLSRLACLSSGHDTSIHQAHGRLSPSSVVTLDETAKSNAGIPISAVRFAYAYPLFGVGYHSKHQLDGEVRRNTPKACCEMTLQS